MAHFLSVVMTFWSSNIFASLTLIISGMELNPALQGNQVRVLVEEMDGGNYTCHLGPDGQYLNHTVILIQLDPDNRTVILGKKSPEEGEIRQMEGASREGNYRRYILREKTNREIRICCIRGHRQSKCQWLAEIRMMVGEGDKNNSRGLYPLGGKHSNDTMWGTCKEKLDNRRTRGRAVVQERYYRGEE